MGKEVGRHVDPDTLYMYMYMYMYKYMYIYKTRTHIHTNSGKEAVKHVGPHTIQAIYTETRPGLAGVGKHAQVMSNILTFTVVAGQPHTLNVIASFGQV
jgi:hypothetical protein